MDKLYKEKMKQGHPSHTTYKEYRNLYNRIKRKNRELYYTTKLDEYKNDIKGIWKCLRPILGKPRDKNSITNEFVIDGRTITDSKKVANEFCDFYTDVGPNLAGNIPDSNRPFHSYLNNCADTSLFLYPATTVEIYDIIGSLRNKKALE